nr:calcium-binding protein [Methylobrevis pamukkalensis]
MLYGSTGMDHLFGGNEGDFLSGGSDDDTLYGEAGNDTLDGGSGYDTLHGGAGKDKLYGGADSDTYYINAAEGDEVYENANGGLDHVFVTGSLYTLTANVERGTLYTAGGTLTGNAENNHLFGSTGNETLYGLGGHDTLDGGIGADTFYGGAGDDTFIVENVGDKVIEYSGGGVDTVITQLGNYTLGDHVENLKRGNDGAGKLTGNGGANTITGNINGDTIDGGAGQDVMIGGKGNDFYYVDDLGDSVIEKAGEGLDEVFASTAVYTMTDHVEQLHVTYTGGQISYGNGIDNWIDGNTGNDQMFGYAGKDKLVGEGGDDLLYGGSEDDALDGGEGEDLLDGGTGADTMLGGIGDDTYMVDDAGDKVVEMPDGGFDVVNASTSYTLGNYQIEELVLTGANAIDGTGNGGINHIVGNNAANVLDGQFGADTLEGKDGNDTYVVDNVGDKTVETADQGIDTVLASASFSLKGQYVENLTLTGDGDINGTGNKLDNTIKGNGAANVLDGAEGADSLEGGAGADQFVFSTKLGASNIDTIVDFKAVDDTILLDDAIFKTLDLGALAAGEFRIGAAAKDADDHVIYAKGTGALYYDADGNGAGAAIQFATLDTGLSLTSADFLVI